MAVLSTATGIAKVVELQQLAARLNAAIEAYASNKTESTNEIAQLGATLQHRAETPDVFAERIRYQAVDLCALMVAVEGGVLQLLSGREDKDFSADELAELSKRPRSDIVRSLRLLTAMGVCDETGYQHYRANDKTPVMASKGQVGGFRVSSLPCSAVANKIEEYFSKRANGDAPEFFEKEAKDSSVFAYIHGKSMYDALRDDKNMRADFDWYMEARKREATRRWYNYYPIMEQLGPAAGSKVNGATTNGSNGTSHHDEPVTIVDVGGARGHDLAGFASDNPTFDGRLVLQDLPETVNPIAGEEHVFEVMPYDFFTPQPVLGAKFYLLLACLHNWDDAHCIKILKGIAAAMKKGYSKLLISALLMPDQGAERRQAELDVQMWMLMGTLHRSEAEMRYLLTESGLDVLKIWKKGERELILETQLAA